MFPPIVTFCLRWYAAPTHAVCVDQDCSISWYTSLLWPLVFYSFWQVRLPLRAHSDAPTVGISSQDRAHRRRQDEEGQGARYELAVDDGTFHEQHSFVANAAQDFKPHPIYKAARKRGYTGSAVFVLVGTI